MLLALERDHSEKLSPKIRRALLPNILPNVLQSRLLEHLDRLTDYAQVREKVVSLVQSHRNPDAMDCSLVDGGFQSVQSEDEATGAEGYTEEEEAMDLAALADVVCRRCQKKGHFARNCRMPPTSGAASAQDPLPLQLRWPLECESTTGGGRKADVPDVWQDWPCQGGVLEDLPRKGPCQVLRKE